MKTRILIIAALLQTALTPAHAGIGKALGQLLGAAGKDAPAVSAPAPAAAPAPVQARPASLPGATPPLTGDELGFWRSNIWVSGQFGSFFKDTGGGVYLAKAVEGKKDGAYYVFGAYRLDEQPGGKAGVVVYKTRCEFWALIGGKCSDPTLAGFTATDDGVLLDAWSDGGKKRDVADAAVKADFLAVRKAWTADYQALYASTMTQEQLDKIFGPGVVHPAK